MSRLTTGIIYGALAGAAGATALNAATYADQALRGRPGGSTPQATVDALADAAGTDVPGSGEQRDNRSSGLGQLAGYGVGVGMGALGGVLRAYGVKLPRVVASVALGLGAMAVSDSTMTALGVTDPRKWDPATVAMDAGPHLAYGLATVAALHRMIDPHTPQVS